MELNINDENIRGIIFDLDGTMYFQKPVRRAMFFALVRHYAFRWKQWKYLYGIYLFRKIREEERFKSQPYCKQVEYVSCRINVSKTELSGCIEKWMFHFPLNPIKKYKNPEILSFLDREQTRGKKIIVYSDYPVEEKLRSLKVKADYIFYPGMHGIADLKPSEEAMRCILETVGLNPEELLFIGDREDSDGASARLVGIPFVSVHQLSSANGTSSRNSSMGRGTEKQANSGQSHRQYR